MANIIYITGGARSGKSSFAEELAKKHTDVLYIATAACLDEEMQDRINRHQQQRSATWQTIEEQLKPYNYINKSVQQDAILLDCLSVWVSNLILQYWNDETGFTCAKNEVINKVLAEVKKLTLAADHYNKTLIVVSNEVGSGIVPMSALARYYRDCLGLANQLIANQSNKAYWCVSGISTLIKGDKNEK